MVHEFRRGFIGVVVHLLAGYAAAQAHAHRTAIRSTRRAGIARVTPEDLKKGKELDERFVKAAREGHWDDASVAAEELLALCKRTHGATHFETVTVFWRVQVVRSVRAMSKDDQAVMLSTNTFFGEAVSLEAQGKYAGAQPLRERMLEIDRRLLGDDHPTTAGSYCALASNLGFRGNFGEAQPLFEKALDVRRRLLGVNHPETAATYDLLAINLMEQGQYDAAQVLVEKALVISRRLLGDQDTRTACIWNDLALILMRRGVGTRRPSPYSRGHWRSPVASLVTATVRHSQTITIWPVVSTRKVSTRKLSRSTKKPSCSDEQNSASSIRRWPQATTIWRRIFKHSESMPQPNRSSERQLPSIALCGATVTRIRPIATIASRKTSRLRGSSPKHLPSGRARPIASSWVG